MKHLFEAPKWSRNGPYEPPKPTFLAAFYGNNMICSGRWPTSWFFPWFWELLGWIEWVALNGHLPKHNGTPVVNGNGLWNTTPRISDHLVDPPGKWPTKTRLNRHMWTMFSLEKDILSNKPTFPFEQPWLFREYRGLHYPGSLGS